MTRSEFEELVVPYVKEGMKIVDETLKHAKISANDIHDIVLVGGSTKIPKVHQMLKERFKGVQLKHSVNPDQAVAYGAAIQAAINANGQGMVNKVSVQDVTPFSIGIENYKDELEIQVPKNSKIPFSSKADWHTVEDYQHRVIFPIFEGEDPVAKNNRLLGTFVLNVPSMKKGKAEMKVTTIVDEEGIVKVKAVCLIDGAENDIVIDTFKGQMTKKEIEEGRIRFRK